MKVLGVPLRGALGIEGRVLGEKYIGLLLLLSVVPLQVSDPETELLGQHIGTSLMSKNKD